MRRNKFKTCKNKMNKRVEKIAKEVLADSDWYNNMSEEERKKWDDETNYGCF